MRPRAAEQHLRDTPIAFRSGLADPEQRAPASSRCHTRNRHHGAEVLGSTVLLSYKLWQNYVRSRPIVSAWRDRAGFLPFLMYFERDQQWPPNLPDRMENYQINMTFFDICQTYA